MNVINLMRTTLLAGALAGVALTVPSLSAQATCLNKKETRKVVNNGDALPFSAVKGKVRGEIVRAVLCQEGNKYVYRITVLSKKGDVKTVKVNAAR